MKTKAHSVGNSEESLFEKHTWADVGWGFVVAWGLSIIFTDTFTEGASSNMGAFWVASMIGTPVVLLAFYRFSSPMVDAGHSDILQLLSLAGMTLGTIALALSFQAGGVGTVAIQIGAGFVSAFGAATFCIMWGFRYASFGMLRIERSAVLSLAVSFFCYAVVLLLPNVMSAIFVALLPFLSLFCLKSCTASEKVFTDGLDDVPTGAFHTSGFTRLGMGIVATTTTISLFWSMANNGTIILPHELFELSVLSGTVVAAFLMLYLMRFARSLNLGNLYRWVLPLVALAFALLFFPGDIMIFLACSLLFAAQALLNLLTFVYFAELSARTGASPKKVFGLGRFFVEVGFLLGIIFSFLIDPIMSFCGGFHGVLSLALVFLIVFTMGSIAIQNYLAFSLSDRTCLVEKKEPGDFEAACDVVAEKYCLTAREREILFYLAQGYSLPYIRNELYIAQSTIDTHVGHIYKKMGIHSKEELITEVRSKQ